MAAVCGTVTTSGSKSTPRGRALAVALLPGGVLFAVGCTLSGILAVLVQHQVAPAGSGSQLALGPAFAVYLTAIAGVSALSAHTVCRGLHASGVRNPLLLLRWGMATPVVTYLVLAAVSGFSGYLSSYLIVLTWTATCSATGTWIFRRHNSRTATT